MAALRILFRAHRRLAGLLLSLALLAKIMIPGGFMPVVTSNGLVLELCSGMERTQAPMAMAMPGMAGDHHDQKGDKAESACSFAGLTAPVIAGADPALLAIAVLFIVALGRVAERRVVLSYRHALRPPLRGPPVAA